MRAWKNFVLAYISVISFTFVFQSLPPVLQLISEDLRLDHAEAGLLMGLFALPGILLTIPGGRLIDRTGAKRVLELSLLVMLVGASASAFAPNYLTLGAARLFTGAGGLIMIVAAATFISNSFEGRGLGKAMGFYGTALPLGTIIGFSLFGFIGDIYGWRAALLAPGLLAVVPLILIFLFMDDRRWEDPGSDEEFFDTLKKVWPLGAVWLWFNAAFLGWLTFAPEYLTGLGFTPDRANLISSLVMGGALVVSPAIGPRLTSLGRKARLMIAGTLMTAAFLAVMPSAPAYAAPLTIILGLTAALTPAPLFAAPSDLTGHEHQGVAFGIIATSLNIGILLGPWAIGWSYDLAGSYGPGFYLMAGFSILATLSALPLLWRRV